LNKAKEFHNEKKTQEKEKWTIIPYVAVTNLEAVASPPSFE
jgi:hypothetical protein